jgi:hypothetical protein
MFGIAAIFNYRDGEPNDSAKLLNINGVAH